MRKRVCFKTWFNDPAYSNAGLYGWKISSFGREKIIGNAGEKNLKKKLKKIGEIEEENNGENLGWKMKLVYLKEEKKEERFKVDGG